MKRRWSGEEIWIACTFLAILILAFLSTCAHALEVHCPPAVNSCKVFVLMPEEETFLLQPRGVFETAAQGRTVDLAAGVAYLRSRLEHSETITVPPNPPKTEIVPPAPVPLPQSRPSQAPAIPPLIDTHPRPH